MKRPPWIVYCLITEDGTPFYVGVTRDIKRRMKEHKTSLGHRPIYRELETGESDRGEAEHRWIEKFRANGFVLANKTVGGNGGQGLSAEARALVSAFHKGRPKSLAHRAKIKAALIGNTPAWSEEGLQRQKRFESGHKMWDRCTPEQRERMLANLNPGTTEERSAMMRKTWASLSPEKRAARLAKLNARWVK